MNRSDATATSDHGSANRPSGCRPRSRMLVERLLCLILIAGCSPEDNRLSVSGRVTLDGQDLTSGSISFVPVAAGPTCGTNVEKGNFRVDAARGAVPGDYHVRIESWQPTGKTRQGIDGEGTIQQRQQIIPARYNQQTELRVSVDAAHTSFDFALSSD